MIRVRKTGQRRNSITAKIKQWKPIRSISNEIVRKDDAQDGLLIGQGLI